jgi:hypothetical protein
MLKNVNSYVLSLLIKKFCPEERPKKFIVTTLGFWSVLHCTCTYVSEPFSVVVVVVEFPQESQREWWYLNNVFARRWFSFWISFCFLFLSVEGEENFFLSHVCTLIFADFKWLVWYLVWVRKYVKYNYFRRLFKLLRFSFSLLRLFFLFELGGGGGINIRPWRLQTTCRSLCCFLFLEEENEKKWQKMIKTGNFRGCPFFNGRLRDLFL